MIEEKTTFRTITMCSKSWCSSLQALCKHLACQVAIGHWKCVGHGGVKNHQTLTSFCRHKEVVIIFFFFLIICVTEPLVKPELGDCQTTRVQNWIVSAETIQCKLSDNIRLVVHELSLGVYYSQSIFIHLINQKIKIPLSLYFSTVKV